MQHRGLGWAASSRGTASDAIISFFLVCPAAPSSASDGVTNHCRRLGNRHLHPPFPSCLTLSKSLHLSAPSRVSISKEPSSESYGGGGGCLPPRAWAHSGCSMSSDGHRREGNALLPTSQTPQAPW